MGELRRAIIMTHEPIATDPGQPSSDSETVRLRAQVSVYVMLRFGVILLLVVLGLATVWLLYEQWRVTKAMRIANTLCGGGNGSCGVWTHVYCRPICESVGYDPYRPPVWWPRYIFGVTMRSRPVAEWFSILDAAPQLEVLNVDGVKLTDAQVAHIGHFWNLTELNLSFTKVSGSNLKSLRGLQRLTKLNLSGCPVDDAGMDHICQMKSLRELNLHGTYVTDSGLCTLANSGLGLVDLTLDCDIQRNLENAGYPSEVVAELTNEHRKYVITDEGLLELIKLRSLESLSISSDNVFVTKSGLQRLRAAMPTCRINGR